MKNINKIFLSIVLICLFGLFALSPIRADNLKNAFGGSGSGGSSAYLGKTADKAGYNTNANSTLEAVVGSVISTLLSLLGIIFLGLIIYAGFTWMTAHGHEEKIKTAQAVMRTAIIGLIIILAAYGISYYILSSLTNEALNQEQTSN